MDSSASPARQHKVWIRDMFTAIVDRYDILNTILSAGAHSRWKRAVAREAAVDSSDVTVDLCCGTGDVLLQLTALAAPETLIVGVDFAPAMLAAASRRVAQKNRPHTVLVCADAEALPFPDGVAGAVTIAFGLRNLPAPHYGLDEMHRILRPGGRLVALDTAMPPHPLTRAFYEVYTRVVMAGLGGWVSGGRFAYQYLADSIHQWLDPDALSELMRACGFDQVGFRSLSGGVAVLHTAHKPPRNPTR